MMRTITSRVMSKAYTQPLRSFNSRTMLSMQTPLKHSSCSSLSSFHSSAAPCAASKKISIKQVKALREITSAPMVECKDALNAINEEHAELSEDEVLDKAVEWLRKKGVATAAKKGGRSAMEGLVGLRVNADATAAAVVEVNSETDFAAKNDRFQALVHDVSCTALSHTVFGEIDINALKDSETLNEGEQKQVSKAVTDLVSSLRENISVRRGAAVQGDVVSTYMHTAMTPMTGQANGDNAQLGRIGCVVALTVKEGADKQQVQEFGSQIAMHIAAAKPAYLSREVVPSGDLDKEMDILREQARAQGKPESVVEKIVSGRVNKFYQEQTLLEQEFMVGDSDKALSVSKTIAQKAHALTGDKNGIQVAGYLRYQVGDGMEVVEKESFEEEVARKAGQQ